MLTLDLDKFDLIDLVKSKPPSSYQSAEDAMRKGWGELKGFPNEKWYWNGPKLNDMTEQELYKLYLNLKLKGSVD
jgi:hypothetical protein